VLELDRGPSSARTGQNRSRSSKVRAIAFPEPGAIGVVIDLAAGWFEAYLENSEPFPLGSSSNFQRSGRTPVRISISMFR
jgi:hypothetical protein